MREIVRLLPRLRLLLGPRAWWRLAALAAMAVGVTGLELVGASALYALLALVDGGGAEAGATLGPLAPLLPDGTAPEALRIGVAVGLVVFFVLRGMALVARSYAEARVVNGAVLALAERLMRGYLALPYLAHTGRSSAQLLRETMQSPKRVGGEVLRPLAVIVAEVLLAMGLVGLLLATDPLAAVAGGGVLAVAVLLIQRVLRPRLRVWGRLAHQANEGAVRAVQEALGGIRDVKVLGREAAFVADFSRHQRRLARSQILAQTSSGIPRAAIELALVVTVVAVFLTAATAADGGTIAVSGLGLLAYAGLRLQPALQSLVAAVNTLRYGAPVVEQVLDELATLPEGAPADGTDLAGPTLTRAVTLHGVGLRYPAAEAADRWALRGVDLELRRGEFLGICGPTGGGKSTLLDVIAGLLPPTDGEVRIDGIQLGPEPRWWWRQLGVVSQAVFLVDASLRRNITLGAGDDDPDRLARCVRAAQLDEVVAGLPDGLDTVVGERGIRLSGGQRQRVALARALYRDPPVVLLDEGTSALDTETEGSVMAALGARGADRTLVAVAHRLVTIRTADRIAVVEGGRVVGLGSWDELLADCPAFRRLVPTDEVLA